MAMSPHSNIISYPLAATQSPYPLTILHPQITNTSSQMLPSNRFVSRLREAMCLSALFSAPSLLARSRRYHGAQFCIHARAIESRLDSNPSDWKQRRREADKKDRRLGSRVDNTILTRISTGRASIWERRCVVDGDCAKTVSS
jgi:hypothetical protein